MPPESAPLWQYKAPLHFGLFGRRMRVAFHDDSIRLALGKTRHVIPWEHFQSFSAFYHSRLDLHVVNDRGRSVGRPITGLFKARFSTRDGKEFALPRFIEQAEAF